MAAIAVKLTISSPTSPSSLSSSPICQDKSIITTTNNIDIKDINENDNNEDNNKNVGFFKLADVNIINILEYLRAFDLAILLEGILIIIILILINIIIVFITIIIIIITITIIITIIITILII